MCADMRVHMCVNMCVDMYVDMCVDMCIDTQIDICARARPCNLVCAVEEVEARRGSGDQGIE